MKSWIKEQLREGLAEMAPVAKQVYGHGTEHDIYPSKTNPNILYKVGDKNNVLKWLSIFQKFPKLFPKVYAAAELKNRPGLYYVTIEKLNTARVTTEWDQLEKAMQNSKLFDDDFEDNLDYAFDQIVSDEDYSNWIDSEFKRYNPNLYYLYTKWANFLHHLNSIVKPLKGGDLDIHRGNFAYDNKGNIKAIDI